MSRIIKQGEYTIAQASNNHIHIYKGNEFVCHMSCDIKQSEKELIETLDFYKKHHEKREQHD